MATADRFRAMATKVHKPLADILRTASYLDYDTLLDLHARRAIAEQRTGATS